MKYSIGTSRRKSLSMGYRIIMNGLFLVFVSLSLGFEAVQAQVQTKLQQPPMNHLGVKDLWNITLQNMSGQEAKITLEGTVDEAKEGRIVDGKTGAFKLKGNETKRITADNIPGGGTYNWSNKKYQETILRTGTAPSGSYTICIYVKNETGEQLGMDCIQQSIEMMSPPTLLSPADGETIPDGKLVTFTWMPPTPTQRDSRYRIKIVEILGSQSVTEAMQRNAVAFEKGDIRTTTYQYPTSAKKLVKGKKYAWMVESGNTQSSVFSFAIGSDLQLMGGANADFSLISIDCIGTVAGVKKYHIKVKYENMATSTNNIRVNDNGPFPGNAQAPAGPEGYNLRNNIRTKTGTYNSALTINNILESSNGTITNIMPSPGFFPQNLIPGSSLIFEFDLSTNPISTNLIFYGLVDDVLKGNTNKNTRNEILTINKFPECPCTYCMDDMILFNGANVITVLNNVLTLNTNISIPGIQVKQFKAELIGISYYPSNGNLQCWVCNNNSAQWGNFVSGRFTAPFPMMLNGTFPSLPLPIGGNSHHTIGWWGHPVVILNKPLQLKIGLPPGSTLNCCPFKVEFCVRYSFTDSDCRTCSVVKCYQYIRQPQVIYPNPNIEPKNPTEGDLQLMDEPMHIEEPVDNDKQNNHK